MVRCARCRATWFAGEPQPDEDKQEIAAFIDDVIAEAEASTSDPPPFLRAPAGDPTPPPPVEFHAPQFRAEEENVPAFTSEPAPEAVPDPVPEPTSEAAPHRESFEPEPIQDAPSLVPPLEHAPTEEPEPWHESDDIETLAARRQRLKSRRKQAKRSSRWIAIILVLFAFNVALIGGRSEVVRYLPQTASLFATIGLPVNLQHLKFENVRIVPNGKDGGGLTVEGAIVSTASTAIKVPDLRFAARNAAGQEIYTWFQAPAHRMLDPGAKLHFHSDLASPPADAKDVLVRFLTAQEAAAMRADKAARAMNPGPGDGDRLPDQ